MQIHYDLDGCHGTLTCTERTNRPSFWGLLLLGVLLAGLTLAVLAFGLMGFIPAVLIATMALAGGANQQDRLGTMKYSAEASEAEEPALNWVFAKREVRRAFRVEGHLLSFDAQQGERLVDLRNATIRASDAGVFVDPPAGEPLELYWDDAIEADAIRLADALRNISDRQLGDQTDVPEQLRTPLRTVPERP